FVDIRFPFELKEIDKGGVADKAGITTDHKILSVNGQSITYFDELQSALANAKNQEADFELLTSSNDTIHTMVAVTDRGTVDILVNPMIDMVQRKYGFTESLKKGTAKAFTVVIVNAKAMGKMFTGEVSTKNVSGPIGMAKIYGDTWNWTKFWTITGLISMILAFMNFLPIPALDGGHVVFLLYEMISGRAPSDRFLENAQKVGMVILLALMVFAIGNDVLKIFTGEG